jgi:radical SAM superfamily enzyme YgiQ (UPF0313 family)
MEICLITAPTLAEFADPLEVANESVVKVASKPQLGVLSLAAVLEARSDSLRIADLNRCYFNCLKSSSEPWDEEFAEVAARDIAAKRADVYGFSSICSSYPLTLRIAKRVKATRPESKILLGGPQASVVDVRTLASFPFVDLVLRGEAEHTLPLLLGQLECEQRLEQVPGLTYRSGGKLHRNANAPVVENLDLLPSPAYHLTGDLHGVDTAALELGRGCPFACTFCSTNDFFRRNFRLRSPNRVLQDMRVMASTYAIRDFELVHDMFTVDRRRVAAFCEAMIASREEFTWSCSARTDCIDEELLELMARAGCRGIFFGVESGSERMQKIIDKHLDPRRAEEVIDATERLGIHSTVSLITGFPEETWVDVRQTMRIFMHSARCPKSNPQLNLLAPLAETPLYSKHKNELVLEELCSSMSHQSRRKNDEDLELIRDYPDIFSNFYAIPTRHLDRASLLELREFALMGLARLRWVLAAIDQNTASILDFFLEWRDFRLRVRPRLEGLELRGYYRTDTFQTEFLSFVRSHEVGGALVVKALLDYEDAVRRASTEYQRATPMGAPLSPGAPLQPRDKPITKRGVRVIELNYEVQSIVDGLKLGSKPAWETGPHYYVMRELSPGLDRLDRVSDWMALLLRLCDGRRRIRQIVPRLSMNLSEFDKSVHEYICMRLIAGAQELQLVDVYRGARATNNRVIVKNTEKVLSSDHRIVFSQKTASPGSMKRPTPY